MIGVVAVPSVPGHNQQKTIIIHKRLVGDSIWSLDYDVKGWELKKWERLCKIHVLWTNGTKTHFWLYKLIYHSFRYKNIISCTNLYKFRPCPGDIGNNPQPILFSKNGLSTISGNLFTKSYFHRKFYFYRAGTILIFNRFCKAKQDSLHSWQNISPQRKLYQDKQILFNNNMLFLEFWI